MLPAPSPPQTPAAASDLDPGSLLVSEETLHDLGWPEVLASVRAECTTDLAADRLSGSLTALGFPSSLSEIHRRYSAVRELHVLLESGGRLPLTGLEDVRDVLEVCSRSGIASVEDVRRVATTATQATTLVREVRRRGAELEVAGGLAAESAGLGSLGELEGLALLATELEETFDPSGHVRDDASDDLRAARRRHSSLTRSTRARLQDLIADRELAELLQEDYFTLRESRYVLPIRAELQSRVPGIIHGTSQTGQTVFIEPRELVEANNALTLAEGAVEQAIRQVLAERSAWIAGEAQALEAWLEAACALDHLQARALWGFRWEASVPEVASEGALCLMEARNPVLMLDGVDVIANDIVLEDGESFLVVTGPNTGGKTVTLDTAGLLSLMVHAALPITAGLGSRALALRAIHAVIGDAQDLHRDLSTFSGHVVALCDVLEQAGPRSLVLLDELATGTEPTRGAALGISVLEALADRGARGFVTTHYERLKLLPYESPRFANASVGFDAERLEPTFRLEIGAPGISSPFEVAERLGLPASVLERARGIASGDTDLAAAVQRLESARQDAEREARAASSAAHEAKAARARLDRERRRLQRQASEEIARLQEDVRKEVDAALEVIRVQVREAQREKSPRELARLRKEVLEAAERAEEAAKSSVAEETKPPPALPAPLAPGPAGGRSSPEPHDAGDLSGPPSPGDPIWVRALGRPGEVVGPRGAQWTVAVGGLRMTVKARDLGVLGGPPPPPPLYVRPKTAETRRVSIGDPLGAEERRPLPRTEGSTIDLRGLRTDDVDGELRRGISRGTREALEVLWIIHGYGTGALRAEVRRLIVDEPMVICWRAGRDGEGGDGVTLAWLR